MDGSVDIGNVLHLPISGCRNLQFLDATLGRFSVSEPTRRNGTFTRTMNIRPTVFRDSKKKERNCLEWYLLPIWRTKVIQLYKFTYHPKYVVNAAVLLERLFDRKTQKARQTMMTDLA